MPDNVIPVPDDFVAISEPRRYPFYVFVIDNEVAITLDLSPVIGNYDKLNAIFSSSPQIIPRWDRIPEGYIYDPENGTFSAPE